MSEPTRTQFVAAAAHLFAARGFYGTSLANVADELGLTKQALIHHFGTKERLYGAVLSEISDRLTGMLAAAHDESVEPSRQIRAFFARFADYAAQHPGDIRLILRELLDNKQRAETAAHWYLKPFLEELARMVQAVPHWRRAPDAQALAVAYQFLGAISYFTVSGPTLLRILGPETFDDLSTRFPDVMEDTLAAVFDDR